MTPKEPPVVLLCADLGSGPNPLGFEALAGRLRHYAPGAVVIAVPEVCASPGSLTAGLAGLGSQRVVLGCRASHGMRNELVGHLLRGGLSPAGARVVDLHPAADASRPQVLKESAALLAAAAAQLAATDLTGPVRDVRWAANTGVSRSELIHFSNGARRYVASWSACNCGDSPVTACRVCVLACPRSALRGGSGRVEIDPARCNGCGACVTVCPAGAWSLPGVSLEAFGAALAVLTKSVRQEGSMRGIVIACESSALAPHLGDGWLTLAVPSLEMVTGGWLLQALCRGVEVRVVGCEDFACGKRALDLDRFGLATTKIRQCRGLPVGPRRLRLREPLATTEALAALGSVSGRSESWAFQGAGCPLGTVRIDAERCSACGVCAASCPTRALTANSGNGRRVSIAFDASKCTACGACAVVCPERAVSVRRATSGREVAGGRRVLAGAATVSCSACGAPLFAGLAPSVMARILGETDRSEAAIAPPICAECRLVDRPAETGKREPVGATL
jgi:Fe-S-cluster-containing hydrogenase component 2